jgi:hypothetical protein
MEILIMLCNINEYGRNRAFVVSGSKSIANHHVIIAKAEKALRQIKKYKKA